MWRLTSDLAVPDKVLVESLLDNEARLLNAFAR